ncbi:LruC domain-containing protein [Pontibacter oryzae]|uniref:LruC domain-containing protein n=1 Tax=Pontibacter oryzae TaxID=2304593 RepID=A0A399SI26_9BACT|nr:LruC domain-containing protein [Pontibacter oryzae]RIJ42519.1 LruC domain-containing protein [Pontibacter oryzae]
MINLYKSKNVRIGALLAAPLLALSVIVSCQPEQEGPSLPLDGAQMSDLVVPSNFNYASTRSVKIIVKAQDDAGTPMQLPMVQFYNAPLEEGGKLLAEGGMSVAGVLSMVREWPVTLSEVVVVSNYLGVADQVSVPIHNGQLLYTFRPLTQANLAKQGFSAMRSAEAVVLNQQQAAASGYTYLGAYETNGKPKYLEAENDVVDAQFLKDINATLPESKPVPTFNPQYLASSNQTDIKVLELADIWVTFVHEGAGWLNALGFYTYPLDNPPKTVADIDTKTIIFPNVSYSGSGGGLASGNKVKIGRFPANTGIGWFLVSNGWSNSTRTVGTGNYTVYSNPALNPEPDELLRQHNVLIKDQGRNKLLLAFEDVRRDNIPFKCDQDFNDAVFYVTASPYRAIDNGSMPVLKQTGLDSDQDGVADEFDRFPLDPTRAYANYSPAKDIFGTLAFEDLWPAQGDFDMNDLVLQYQYLSIANAKNEIVELNGKFVVKAIGASFHNGFGFQLPIAPELVRQASGSNLKHNYVKLNPNGTEASQRKATFIVFDDAFDHIKATGGTFNTQADRPKGTSDTLKLHINFTQAIDASVMGTVPFNPFIMVNKNRGQEVHLPGMEPTDLVDQTFFGKSQDGTDLAKRVYYKTKTNLPFALHLPLEFEYPYEKKNITASYLKFAEWAQSGGILFPDWYMPLTGFRNNSNIYK